MRLKEHAGALFNLSCHPAAGGTGGEVSVAGTDALAVDNSAGIN